MMEESKVVIEVFGRKVREERKKLGLSQEKLGEMIDGSKAIITAYETGIRQPSYGNLIKLAKIFGVSTDYLLGLK